MNFIPQIKAAKKTAIAQLERSKKSLAKTEKNLHAAAAAHRAAQEQVTKDASNISKYDEMLKVAGPEEKTTGKTAKAAPVAKTSKKASAKAAPAAKAGNSHAAMGRRAVLSGKRPPIKESIAKVLGNRVMNSQQIFEAIKAKGQDQLPDSNDPKSYIGYLLSASKVTDPKTGQDVPLWERVASAGRGFYKNRGVVAKAPAKTAATKAAPGVNPARASKTAAPAGKKTVKCKICNQPGHNSRGHDKWASAKAVPAKAVPAKAAAPKVSPATRQNKCKICNQPGHNSKGHDKALAKAAAPAAKAPKAATVKAAAAPKAATAGKQPNKCKICNQPGHNSKGHDKAVAKANGVVRTTATVIDKTIHTNGTTAAAKPAPVPAAPESAPAPVKAESTPAPVKAAAKTTDEILAEAGIDLGGPMG